MSDSFAFIATKFNAETDEDRPRVGEKIEDTGKIFVIKKVDWLSIAHFISGGSEPDNLGYTKVLLRGHVTRPAVIWVAWCNEEESANEKLTEVYDHFAAQGAWGEPVSRQCKCRGPKHPEGHWTPNASTLFHFVFNNQCRIAGLNREADGSFKLYLFQTSDATFQPIREVSVGELEAIAKQINNSTWQRPVNTEG